MADASTQVEQVSGAAAAAAAPAASFKLLPWCVGAALLGAALLLAQAGIERSREAGRVLQLSAAIAALPSEAAPAGGSAQREAARAWKLVVQQVHPGSELVLSALKLLSQHTLPGVVVERMAWDGDRLVVQGRARDSAQALRLAVWWDTVEGLGDARRTCKPPVLSQEPASAAGTRQFTIGWRCWAKDSADAAGKAGEASPPGAAGDTGGKAGGSAAESDLQWTALLREPAVAAPLAALLLLSLWRAVAGSGRPWPALRWQSQLLQLQGNVSAAWPRALQLLAVLLAFGAGAFVGSQAAEAWLASDGKEMELRSRHQALLAAPARQPDPDAAALAQALAAADRADPLPGLQRQLAAVLQDGRLATGQVTGGDEAVKDYHAQRTLVLNMRGNFDASSRWLAQVLDDPLRRLSVTRFNVQRPAGAADDPAEWRLELSAIRPVSAEEVSARRRDAAARAKTP